jgi:hypothetical protein
MRILWPIATTHCHYQSRNLAASLETSLRKRTGYEKGKERITGDNNVCARDQNRQQPPCPGAKELFQSVEVGRFEDSETR